MTDPTVGAFLDFFRAEDEPQHAFVVDDRLASSQLAMGDSLVVTLVNVLAELRRSGHLADITYFHILLRLRRANCRFIDLDGDEIVYWLTKAKIVNGVVEESEPLQILRVYLNAALSDRNLRVAPLHLTNAKGRAIGEGAFAMNSAFAVNRALGAIWSFPDLPAEARMALSDWILRSLYSGTYGVHHLYGGFKEPRLLMVSDLASFLTTTSEVLFDTDFDFARGQEFVDWIWGRIIENRLDADPQLVQDVAAVVNEILIPTAKTTFGRKVIRAVYSLLPNRIRLAGMNDSAFVEAAELRVRPSIRIAGFQFATDAFWAAVESLRSLREVTLRTNAGREVGVTRSPPDGPRGLVFDDGSEKLIFPNDTFASLAFDTTEQQLRHLLARPEIFDIADDELNAAISALLALPTRRERLQRVEEIAKRSAASHYARLRESLGKASIGVNELMTEVKPLLQHYLPGYTGGKLDPTLAFAPLLNRSDLLDILKRSVVLPLPIPEALVARFAKQPIEQRQAILATLSDEAASPVARAQVAILGYASGDDANRQLARTLVDEILRPGAAPQVELFTRVLLWVYWRLSFDENLDADVRFLLAWAHAGRLLGLFMAADLDPAELNFMFLAQGQTFSDDIWTRSNTSLDVLHPLTATAVRIICAAVAHVAASAPTKEDEFEVAERLHKSLFPEGFRYPTPLMHDVTLATNVTGSFMGADIAATLDSIDAETAELLSHGKKMEALSTAMSDIDSGKDSHLGWRVIAAVIGHLPPPANVRSWVERFVRSSSLDEVAISGAALDAFSALVDLQAHFGDDYRQRVDDAAMLAVAHWQRKTSHLDTSTIGRDAERWVTIAVTLAGRAGSREATGAALGRSLRRLIDVAPAVAPSAGSMLTMLPMHLPMEYLAALWPAVIAARAAPSARPNSLPPGEQ